MIAAHHKKIPPGSAEKSYGIQVARLAGLPENVIDRAKEVLQQLESGHQPAESVKEVPAATSVPAKTRKKPRSDEDAGQMSLFGLVIRDVFSSIALRTTAQRFFNVMNQIKVDSLPKFVSHTDDFDIFSDLILYRGQPVQGNLLPSIARREPKRDTGHKEKNILKQLRLLGDAMLSSRNTTDLDLLVSAQHYGLSTRLLDWTSNPLIALWFACSDKSDCDAFVYAFEADNFLIEDVYDSDPFQTSATRAFQPRLNNPRIVAQDGWFTLHRYSKSVGAFVPLERNPKAKSLLTEFQIPSAKKLGIVKSLAYHGISSRTIFPDLEGLCRYLGWKYGV